MDSVTTYRLLRHARSGELWAIRLEWQTLTGVSGPLPPGTTRAARLADLVYDDDRDEAEWIARYYEEFEVLGAT
ncbi:MAG: hypothetical protein ACREJG_08450 [Candidatus Rokuibacteriota bacterium]